MIIEISNAWSEKRHKSRLKLVAIIAHYIHRKKFFSFFFFSVAQTQQFNFISFFVHKFLFHSALHYQHLKDCMTLWHRVCLDVKGIVKYSSLFVLPSSIIFAHSVMSIWKVGPYSCCWKAWSRKYPLRLGLVRAMKSRWTESREVLACWVKCSESMLFFSW